jgi:hypothetical protein
MEQPKTLAGKAAFEKEGDVRLVTTERPLHDEGSFPSYISDRVR